MTNHPPKKNITRTVAILIAIVLVLIGLGIYSYSKNSATTAPPPSSVSPSSTSNSHLNGTLLPTPKSISSFDLSDENDKEFTNNNLKGHWTLLFFGFTHCGDVCPTTLSELNKMYIQLQKDLAVANLPQVAMVTVDPERDTTSVLRNYMQSFNSNFKGLRADAESNSLNIFSKDIGLSYAKVPKDNGNYGMQHSSQLFLINPEGNWIGILNYPFEADQLVKDFKTILSTQQPKE